MLLGIARLAAASRKRSRRRRRGHFTCRFQHLHLMPEHQELDVLLILQATSGSEEAADGEVQE